MSKFQSPFRGNNRPSFVFLKRGSRNFPRLVPMGIGIQPRSEEKTSIVPVGIERFDTAPLIAGNDD
jgi:hypothetical protein